MKPVTIQHGEFIISSDKQLMDVGAIHHWLSNESYWAKGIPFHTVQQAFEHSYTAGILRDGKQVAYARFITDYATFAYLADVYVLPEFRGRGLSKALIGFMLDDSWIPGLRRISLATLDAHDLYRQFGFTPIALPERLMERVGITQYQPTTNTDII
jgi:GNAT superfamily N-acetyltransferase